MIACAGLPKREFADKALSSDLEKILENRSLYLHKTGDRRLSVTEEAGDSYISCAMPIITEGDVTGCVVSVVKDDAARMNPELESKLVRTAADFLGKQLES